MGSSDGIRIVHANGVTRLKWHRARRFATDVPFSAARIAEGFRCGANFEVDIRPHGAGSFVVLHDTTLDRETTGSGPVRAAALETLGHLRMRGPNGAATDMAPLLLEDLGRLASAPDASKQANCQLDLKANLADLDARTVAAFAHALQQAPGRFLVSGGDADAVRWLGNASSIPIGYDPCHDTEGRDLTLPDKADAFVAEAVAAAPAARIIYLDARLALAGLAAGTDLIARFHDRGREVDVYTLNPSLAGLPAILRELLTAGVDQITTDEPVALEAIARTLI